MTLHHGEVDFTDVFVLLAGPTAPWRIANKAYEAGTGDSWHSPRHAPLRLRLDWKRTTHTTGEHVVTA